MMKLPQSARIKTFSHDAQTTDSGCPPWRPAYTTGVKMNNEVIAMSSDTRAVAPVQGCQRQQGHQQLHQRQREPGAHHSRAGQGGGQVGGAVTTTELTLDATPAATYSHICHRDAGHTPSPSRRYQAEPASTRRWGWGRCADGGGVNHWTPLQRQQQGRPGRRPGSTAELTAGATAMSPPRMSSLPSTGQGAGAVQHQVPPRLRTGPRRQGGGPVPSRPSGEMTAKAIDDLLSQNSQGYS